MNALFRLFKPPGGVHPLRVGVSAWYPEVLSSFGWCVSLLSSVGSSRAVCDAFLVGVASHGRSPPSRGGRPWTGVWYRDNVSRM